ncbi:hypothetical protein [uncultured Spirosoma sp.]|uniref:hypothetical protein n=1 Tax=uncultured Spirosoma sp. TaxID=278208 RepID=UPI00258A19B4|nr:hypothetical protein [uncultured Spirosoma sp.]
MNEQYDQLTGLVENHGINRADAEKAVNTCMKSMAKGALQSYFAGGAIMYFMNTNPASAFGYGSIAVGVGAGNAFLNSDECTRVRQALDFWSTATE